MANSLTAFAVQLFQLAPARAGEAAALDEHEHAWELAAVEPDAMRTTRVYDHAARPAEVLPIHHLPADRTGNVPNSPGRCSVHRPVARRD